MEYEIRCTNNARCTTRGKRGFLLRIHLSSEIETAKNSLDVRAFSFRTCMLPFRRDTRRKRGKLAPFPATYVHVSFDFCSRLPATAFPFLSSERVTEIARVYFSSIKINDTFSRAVRDTRRRKKHFLASRARNLRSSDPP